MYVLRGDRREPLYPEVGSIEYQKIQFSTCHRLKAQDFPNTVSKVVVVEKLRRCLLVVNGLSVKIKWFFANGLASCDKTGKLGLEFGRFEISQHGR